MVATDPRDVGFRSTDSETLPEYQPLSRLSLASLLAALLSPIALVHPLLWIVPVIAALLAILALRAIHHSDGELRGSGLARTALVVSLLFGSWAVVWSMSYQYIVGRQARHYSQAWLDLIKNGRLYEAHQLSMSLTARVPPQDSLEETYKKATTPSSQSKAEKNFTLDDSEPERMRMRELSDSYKSFISGPPMDQLLKLKTDWQAEFSGNLASRRLDGYKDEVDQKYTIRYRENEEDKSLDAILTVERERVGDRANWRVSRIVDPATYRKSNR